MGAEQAASVLATIKLDGYQKRGEAWSEADQDAFKQPIRDQYERMGHSHYGSARLWDDGVIDPTQSRRVLGLSLAAALCGPTKPTQFGVFRM